jgi:hypothetical protein
MNQRSRATTALVAVKLTHTVVWCFFVGCILAIPVAALRMNFKAALLLIGFVTVECAVLALNRGRCPLTDVAGRFTEERADNFDIYLPLWIARYNKEIFGPLFAVASLFVLFRWWFTR